MNANLLKHVLRTTMVLPLALLTGCVLLPTASGSCQFKVAFGPTGAKPAGATAKGSIDPPADELSQFNASDALGTFSTQNLNVAANSGTLLLTVTDTATGQALGSDSVAYTVNDGNVYASNPSALQTFLDSFTSYGSMDVTLAYQTELPVTATINTGTVSFAYAVKYAGVTLTTASTSMYVQNACPGKNSTQLCAP